MRVTAGRVHSANHWQSTPPRISFASCCLLAVMTTPSLSPCPSCVLACDRHLGQPRWLPSCQRVVRLRCACPAPCAACGHGSIRSWLLGTCGTADTWCPHLAAWVGGG